VDVTSKTEGKAFADKTGTPLLVKYDARLRENVAKSIVADVNSAAQAAEGAGPAKPDRFASPKAFPRVALDLATTVVRIQQNFVISDPTLPDCPIVFASDAFLELTGFQREEVLGRNCRWAGRGGGGHAGGRAGGGGRKGGLTGARGCWGPGGA
jgi:hypothetical protein